MELVLALIALIIALRAHSTANATRRETALLAQRLENRTTTRTTNEQEAVAPATPVEVVRAPTPPKKSPKPVSSPALRPTPPRRSANDLESFLGGRVMLVVGVLAVLFAVGFFLRYAITLGILGPAARLGLSGAAGLIALFVGDRMRARGVRIWGQAVMGLGISTQFLVIWFAATVYGFLGEPLAMGLALLNTALAVALSVKRSAPFLAHLGFLGGYLAPALLGTATGAVAPWAIWLLVLDLGVLLVATRPGVRGLEPMALGATLLYFESWRHAWLAPSTMAAAGTVLAALVLAKLALAVVPAGVRRARPGPYALLTVLGVTAYGAIVGSDLFADAGAPFGLTLIALAAVTWGSLAWLTRRVGADELRADGAVFHLAGLLALATAVPAVVSMSVRGPALAMLATGAVWIGTSRGVAALRFGGAATLVWALAPLQMQWSIDPEHAFFNPLFVRYLSVGVAAILSGVIMRRAAWGFGAVVGIAGTWLLFPVLALETG